MMLRRRNLNSVLLVGVITSLVLALHYVLVSKQGKLISTPRVVDALENIVPTENGKLLSSNRDSVTTGAQLPNKEIGR